MKKMILLMVFFSLLALNSACVKQKNCDCSEVMTGTWQYLEEPEYVQLDCNPKKIKIVAVFTTEGGAIMYFTNRNPVPVRYQSTSPIEVNLCAEYIKEVRTELLGGSADCLRLAYKLTCIEKEE